MWSLNRSTIKRRKFVDQGIKRCFKAGSIDQEPILAIKNFDRRRSWKYRVYCSDYPLVTDGSAIFAGLVSTLAVLSLVLLVVMTVFFTLCVIFVKLGRRNGGSQCMWCTGISLSLSLSLSVMILN